MFSNYAQSFGIIFKKKTSGTELERSIGPRKIAGDLQNARLSNTRHFRYPWSPREIHFFVEQGWRLLAVLSCVILGWTAAARILLFIRIENPEGAPAVFFIEKNLSAVALKRATCIQIHRRIRTVYLCATRGVVSSLLLRDVLSLSLSPHRFFSESAAAKNAAPPGRASFSRLHTYIAQEVLSSRFCIFFQLRHMPLSISKRVLGFRRFTRCRLFFAMPFSLSLSSSFSLPFSAFTFFFDHVSAWILMYLRRS